VYNGHGATFVVLEGPVRERTVRAGILISRRFSIFLANGSCPCHYCREFKVAICDVAEGGFCCYQLLLNVGWEQCASQVIGGVPCVVCCCPTTAHAEF